MSHPNTDNHDESNLQKKYKMSHPNTDNHDESNLKKKSSIIVLGDAFADLVCHLDGPLPQEPGGDTRLESPITTMAGGSGLNTCTHLCGLLSSSNDDDDDDSNVSRVVSLYTAVNETDPYGILLCNHAKKHGFGMYNNSHTTTTSDDDISNTNRKSNSTGHCAVLVANGERSFLTHLGVMETFEAKDIDTNHIILTSASSPSIMCVHVAGYYNIPGFWNGQLKTTLQTIRDKALVDDQTTTTTPIKSLVTSLLCQYDATEAWDGELMDLLPLVDYLFCNEVEVDKIAKATKARLQGSLQQQQSTDTVAATTDDSSYWMEMAKFFNDQSPDTCVIVTLGPKGALALYGGQIMARQEAPTSVEHPLDPTGAGDAFISGFLYGLLVELEEDDSTTNNDSSNTNGGLPRREHVPLALQYGCAVGTSCISRMGASNPAPRAEIAGLMKNYAS